ncbi:MAG TPA: sensor histidine kinase [Chitinophagaceae bacterium]|jgi:signal transduction histidine kinase
MIKPAHEKVKKLPGDFSPMEKVYPTISDREKKYNAIIESMSAEIARFTQQEALNTTKTSKTEQELKTEIKELEAQLTQEKLYQQKRIAEAIIQAEEKERTKLGHELHDNVNQVLTTARLYLQMLKPGTEKEIAIIEKTKAFLYDAINEIRNISREMVLPNLKGNPLTENIRHLLEDIENTGIFATSFSHKGTGKLEIPEGKKLALFRILQEQLKNIIKHSQANNIVVRLCVSGNLVTLSIKDNGIGFNPSRKSSGIGLSNIYDRVSLYKGKTVLKTAQGEGCLLEVSIPLGEE